MLRMLVVMGWRVVMMVLRKDVAGLGSQAVGQLLRRLLGPCGQGHLYMYWLITHSLTHSFIPLCNDLFTHYLVHFSVAFGLVIGGMKHKGRVLRDFFDSLNEAIMRLVGIIIW